MAKQRDPEDARALLYLGYLYHQGKGVSQNNETAAKLFTKSYKAGRESLDAVQQQASAEAGAQLGIMTLHGYGVVQSRPEGMKYVLLSFLGPSSSSSLSPLLLLWCFLNLIFFSPNCADFHI